MTTSVLYRSDKSPWWKVDLMLQRKDNPSQSFCVRVGTSHRTSNPAYEIYHPLTIYPTVTKAENTKLIHNHLIRIGKVMQSDIFEDEAVRNELIERAWQCKAGEEMYPSPQTSPSNETDAKTQTSSSSPAAVA